MSPPVKQGRDGEQDSTDGSVQHESERLVSLSIHYVCVCMCVCVCVCVWVCVTILKCMKKLQARHK